MRLGQLARKLAMKPIEIVGFLAKQNIIIEEGGNTKLEDDQVALILKKFGPEPEEPSAKPAVIEPPPAPITPETEVAIEIETPANEITEEEKVEVIKAAKVELSGLKVLGKIELPELKKKETPPETVDPTPPAEIEKEPRQDLRKPYPQTRERPNPPQRKNPIALQREREASEARKKRENEIERDKEKRTMHYLKKVNVTQPTKAMKIAHDEPTEVIQVSVFQPPKTLWGRFMRWLNT